MKLAVLWILALFTQFICIDVIRVLKDQRGEIAPDITEDKNGDRIDKSADDKEDPLEGVDLDLGEGGDTENQEKDKTSATNSDAGKTKDGQDKDKGKTLTMEDLQGKITDLEKENKRLGYTLRHQQRDKDKGDGKGEEKDELSDAQLLAIMQQHKDDPTTLFNIVKYMTQKEGKGAKAEAEQAGKIAMKKEQVESRLYHDFPALKEDGSELRARVDAVKSELNIGDHPFADFLGTATFMFSKLPNIMQAEYERGKAEAIKGKADEHRKEDVRNRKPIPPGKQGGDDKATITLTKEQLETAKNTIGLKSPRQIALYAKLLKGKAPTVEV